MSTQNTNSMDLRNLLSKWKLDCILMHLMAEKIDTDVLRMMKPSHIRLLLHNFPLGIQIRFEYNMEMWRQEIGRPLYTLHNTDDRFQSLSKEPQYKQTDIYTNQKAKSSTSLSNNQYDKTPCLGSEEFKPKVQRNVKRTNSTPQVDLHKILSDSPYGIDILKSYKLRKSFSNLERKLLITTIVDYYLQNNKEFNVQISYALERAILKMFPTEKLSYYRITKRGRLYMRYIAAKAAMKRNNDSFHENTDTMDCMATMNEHNDDMDDYTEDMELMNQVNKSAEAILSNLPHFEEDDCEADLMDNSENGGYITADYIENLENAMEIKVEPEIVDEITPTAIDSQRLVCQISSKRQLQIEETAKLFKGFKIPWHKVPNDIIKLLENQEELGKRLNVFSNLLVDELRSISTNIPMKILRTVTQEAIIKYPHSFLEKDSEGKIITSSTMIPLLSRMRNRNTFLNRN